MVERKFFEDEENQVKPPYLAGSYKLICGKCQLLLMEASFLGKEVYFQITCANCGISYDIVIGENE